MKKKERTLCNVKLILKRTPIRITWQNHSFHKASYFPPKNRRKSLFDGKKRSVDGKIPLFDGRIFLKTGEYLFSAGDSSRRRENTYFRREKRFEDGRIPIFGGRNIPKTEDWHKIPLIIQFIGISPIQSTKKEEDCSSPLEWFVLSFQMIDHKC